MISNEYTSVTYVISYEYTRVKWEFLGTQLIHMRNVLSILKCVKGVNDNFLEKW